MILAGFKSRWIIPFKFKYKVAYNNFLKRCIASFYFNFPILLDSLPFYIIYYFNDHPFINYVAKYEFLLS